jgi:purine-cytosine permease-like protein
MSENAKRTYVILMGLIGLAAALIGLFTDIYDFMVGFIIAIVLWVGSSILARRWGAKKEKSQDT